VFTLQSLPAVDAGSGAGAGPVGGFSLHAGVAARADERNKLGRLCRYISRPAVSEARLSLTPSGLVRYQLKMPYSEGTTHVLFECAGFHRRAGRARCPNRASISPASTVCSPRTAPTGRDIETCSLCGGAMRIIACIEDPASMTCG
jgi:hypothetical protein